MKLVLGMILDLIAVDGLKPKVGDGAGAELICPEVYIYVPLRDGVFQALGLVKGPEVDGEGTRVHNVTLVLHLVHGESV